MCTGGPKRDSQSEEERMNFLILYFMAISMKEQNVRIFTRRFGCSDDAVHRFA